MNRTTTLTELLSLISSIKRTLQGQHYRCHDGTNLTSGQLGLLFALKHHGPITANAVAERLSLSPGAISQLIDSLLDRDYIVRSMRTNDRRMYDLSLSPEGQKQVSAIEQERYAIISHATADLTAEELALLVRAHQKILQALQNNVKFQDTKGNPK